MRVLATLLLVLASVAGCDSSEPNTPPTATISYSANPVDGVAVTFTAEANDDSAVEYYGWDFNDDGSTDDEGRTARYTFDRPGSYPVRLTVADDEQAQTTTTTTVTVAQRFTQAQVTSARVLDFPFTTESGASWDATNGPDVYLVAMDASGSTVSTSPPLADVEPADLPFPLVFTPFTIADTSERYVLAIYDADTGSADDFIGGIEFDLSARVGVYPETITLDAGAGVVLEVTLDWAP